MNLFSMTVLYNELHHEGKAKGKDVETSFIHPLSCKEVKGYVLAFSGLRVAGMLFYKGRREDF